MIGRTEDSGAIMLDSSLGKESPMASIVVRGLDESVKRRLVEQAKENGRSMEAEVRDILSSAVRRPHIGIALMRAASEVDSVDDLLIPERSDVARAADFG
jgi:plasmid stability protein